MTTLDAFLLGWSILDFTRLILSCAWVVHHFCNFFAKISTAKRTLCLFLEPFGDASFMKNMEANFLIFHTFQRFEHIAIHEILQTYATSTQLFINSHLLFISSLILDRLQLTLDKHLNFFCGIFILTNFKKFVSSTQRLFTSIDSDRSSSCFNISCFQGFFISICNLILLRAP